MGILEKTFKLSEHGTTVRTECRAGLVTFMTMAYIIFLQPMVLAPAMAGLGATDAEKAPYIGAVLTATCLSAAIATFLMGLLANYPVALAPGMGENFFFAGAVLYGTAGITGLSWQGALLAVFLSGLIFTLLSVFRVRQMVVDAVPDSLKHGIAIGIGLFIAFIGLKHAGVVYHDPFTGVKLGNLASRPVLLSAIGLFVTAFLMARRVKGAILWGILITAAVGMGINVVPRPSGIVASPPSLAPTFCKFDWSVLAGPNVGNFLIALLIFLFMDLFDTVGTLVGVGTRAGLMKDGKLPRATQAFLSDSIGTMVGAACGTSTVTSYIESAAGTESGGRTGLTAVTVGALFLLALFIRPIVEVVGSGVIVDNPLLVHFPNAQNLAPWSLYPVTAPALIIVGSMMLKSVRKINWDEISETLPAFLAMVGIPLTYSIADGLALGFVSYPIVMVFRGKAGQVHWLAYVLAAVFLARYVFAPLSH